jgi:predicted exporter
MDEKTIRRKLLITYVPMILVTGVVVAVLLIAGVH